MGEFAAALFVKTKSKKSVKTALAEILTRQGRGLELSIGTAGGGWLVIWQVEPGSLLPLLGAAKELSMLAPTLTYHLYDSDSTTFELYAEGKRAARITTGLDARIVKSRKWELAVRSLDDFFDAIEDSEEESDSLETLGPHFGFTAEALEAGGEEVWLGVPPPPTEPLPTGPARLERIATSGNFAVRRVGQEHRVSISARNRGGAFGSLRVEITGDALALVTPLVVRVERLHNQVRREWPAGKTEIDIENAGIAAAGTLTLWVHFLVRSGGEGDLRVTCTAPDDAPLVADAHLEIEANEALARKPLRATGDRHREAFDVLASDAYLSALVVYTCEPEQAAAYARELAALAEVAVFGAPVAGKDPSLPSTIVSTTSREKRDALFTAIDASFRRGHVLQATLISWGRAPTTLSSTAYENAVGILEGKDLTRRSWVSRFLRVVGEDTVWLGDAFAPGGLVIEVGGREKRAAVEEELASLLPSASDRRSAFTG